MHHTPLDGECSYEVGDGDFVDITRDIGFVSLGEQSPSSWNAKPDNHNERVDITSTLSEEGMAAIDEAHDDDKFYMYGTGSCFASGDLDGWNETINVGDNNDCADKLYDQMVVRFPWGASVESGDSGALWFTPDPDTDLWYALGSVSGWQGPIADNHGPQGFTIHDIYDRAWRN